MPAEWPRDVVLGAMSGLLVDLLGLLSGSSMCVYMIFGRGRGYCASYAW